MKLFKRKTIPVSNDATAQRIAGLLISRQRQLAGYLNEKAKNWSGKTLLFALIGFCAVFGAFCLYLLIGAIN